MNLPITPETKVGALLEAYPGLEETLIAWVPAFSRLRNPLLRRTVAKVATLEQAARVGGVSVRELVARLREATGQASAPGPAPSPLPILEAPAEAAPAWVVEDRVQFSLDADSMLALGEHPIGKVRQCVAQLEPGGIVALRSSFRPEPLLHALAHGGLRVHCAQTLPGRFVTFIGRPS